MKMVMTMTMMTMMMVIGKRSNGQSGGQETSDKGTEAYVLPPIQPSTSCDHCSAIFFCSFMFCISLLIICIVVDPFTVDLY